jgi:hypothetical protein
MEKTHKAHFLYAIQGRCCYCIGFTAPNGKGKMVMNSKQARIEKANAVHVKVLPVQSYAWSDGGTSERIFVSYSRRLYDTRKG